MKRILLLLSAGAFTAAGAFAQSPAPSAKFVLNGDVAKIKEPIEWVYLYYNVGTQRITDSVLVKGGKYSFSGNAPEPIQASLRVKYHQAAGSATPGIFNRKRDVAMLFLQPGAIAVASADSFANITVTGSKADAEYRKLEEQQKPYNTQLETLYAQYGDARKNKDDAAMKILEKQIDSLDAVANDKVYAAYVKKYPGSPMAMYALQNLAGYDIDAAKIEPLFNSLPASTRNTPSGKSMEEKLVIAKKTGVGQVALDFTQNDTLGNPVALSSLRGKYLLVDFWASWCGPCRAENPNVVKAFDQYKDKGFYILSVSLDRPGMKDKWMKAIHDDGLHWSHVSDLLFWDNAVAKLYGIQAIPQNLLLDPNGKIIAKNLRGDDLTKKLSEILAN
ncbi:MAG TPA: TlpA disulfide reductase family protein [Chitinophagaceae bacterium]|jgi:peroxiredoxin